jgi:hypothetical protein
LDDALAGLSAKDHDAIVLRFFEGKNMQEVGAGLGTNEVSARKRVSRAVEKLRTFFARRGTTLSAAMIAGAVSAHSVQAAPVGLAASVTASAFQATAVSTSTLTLLKGTLKLMVWTKVKTAIVVGVVALLAAGTTSVVVHAVKARSSGYPGYATPEAALQTELLAMSRGDWDKVLASLSTEGQAAVKDANTATIKRGTSEVEVRRQMMTVGKSLMGTQITQKEVISDDEVHLHLHNEPPIKNYPDTILIFKKMGGGWKAAGQILKNGEIVY